MGRVGGPGRRTARNLRPADQAKQIASNPRRYDGWLPRGRGLVRDGNRVRCFRPMRGDSRMSVSGFLRSALSGLLAAGALAFASSAAQAQADKVFVMKLSTATINDTQHEWFKRFAALVEKDSNGRIKPEIYPASQLGSIPRQIEGVQFGSIQGWMGPPEFLAGVDERFEAMTAPGLFTD